MRGTNIAALIVGGVIVLVVIFVLLNIATQMFTAQSAPMFNASAPQNIGEVAAGCSASDFKIREQHGTVEYGFLTVVGVVHNSCSQSAGVEMELSQYSAAGKLLATDRQWPASIQNIGPHQNYDFKLMAAVPDGGVKYAVDVDDARQW